jgi:IclR family KDG regulon transcriptional repressor
MWNWNKFVKNSIDNQENEPCVRCVAIRIHDHTGQVVAAISMSTLVNQVDDVGIIKFTEMLKRKATDMSHKLGYGVPYLQR